MASSNNFEKDESYVSLNYSSNWLEKYYSEPFLINSCLWNIIRSIRSVKIYIFCNNGVIGWPLVSKHKHVPLHGYWRNGIVSSCISSYKCSHLLDEGKIYNHLQADLYVQKFHIHLLSKTLVSKIDKKMILSPWTQSRGPVYHYPNHHNKPFRRQCHYAINHLMEHVYV